jgi:hypothetical protein
MKISLKFSYKNLLDTVAVFFLLISLLTLYPSLLSANYSSYGTIISAFSGICIVLLGFHSFDKLVLLICIVFLFSFLLGGFINTDSNIQSLFGNFVMMTVFTWLALLVLQNDSARLRFNKVFLWVLSLQGLSCGITLSLVVLNYDINNLFIIDFMGHERVPGNMFFPFSFGGTVFTTEFFQIIRFSGVFREPGITQLVYVYYIGYCLYFYKNKWAILFLYIGLLTTLSTTLIITLCFMLSSFYFFKLKKVFTRFIVILAIPLIAILFYKIPYVGLEDKLITHTSTVTDRTQGFQYLLADLDSTYLLGVGAYTEGENDNASINFILSLRENGIFGLICFSILYVFPLFYFKKEKLKMFYVLTSPLVLTFLFVQPIFYSALNLFFFINTYFLVKKDFKIRLKEFTLA